MDGVVLLESEVRELIRRHGVDPLRDPTSLAALVRDAVADYDERFLRGHVPPLTDPAGAVKAVVDAVAGLGPLQQYLDDEVEEIWINSPDQVFIRRRSPIPRRIGRGGPEPPRLRTDPGRQSHDAQRPRRVHPTA